MQIPFKTCEGLMSLLCMDADFDICIEISACAGHSSFECFYRSKDSDKIKFTGVIERDDRLKDIWRSQFLDN